MNRPNSTEGMQGELTLVFGRKGGKTIISHQYCEAPFKLTRLLEPIEVDFPKLILMSTTAGIFGGDTLKINIEVEEGAKVWITSQGATKIHPSQNRTASIETYIKLQNGASLIWTNEPIIPFEESKLRQVSEIDLSSESSLLYWEGLASGRILSGESWTFQDLSSSSSLKLDNELQYLDRFTLNPSQSDPGSDLQMGPNHYLVNFLAYNRNISEPIVEECRRFMTKTKNQVAADLLSQFLISGRILCQKGFQLKKALQNLLLFYSRQIV